MSLVLAWSKLFALTLVAEIAVAVPLLGNNRRLSRRFMAVSFAQLASHPLVWFVLPEFGMRRLDYVLLAESWAVVSELLLYRLVFEDLSLSRALAIAALANGVSFAVGTFLPL